MKHPRLEALGGVILGNAVPRLPRRTAMGLGRALGSKLHDFDHRHAKEAQANLERAFPEWDQARTARVVRDVYGHFGAMLFEILWLRGKTPAQLMPLVDWEGTEHVEEAMARGRGLLCITAHIGNWEMHGVVHGMRFGKIAVVARQQDNPALDRRLNGIRAMAGNVIIYKKKALQQMITWLRGGGGLAVLIDQNTQDGVFVDYFGRAAGTTTVAGAVALRLGCALVPTRTRLMPDGRWRAIYEPPLVTKAGESLSGAAKKEEVVRITQELTSAIERWVRETPEQWLWLHRRWKTRPVGEPAGAPAPVAGPLA